MSLRLGRLARFAGAFVIVTTILLGIPAALIALGHWPITGFPTARQLSDLPDTIVSDTAVFGVLTVAAWRAVGLDR